MEIAGKKILILGMAREGTDSLRYFLAKYPAAEIAVADRAELERLSKPAREILAQNPRVLFFGGIDYLESLKNYDLIVKSPGIPIHLPAVENAYRQGKVTSQSEIFFKECPGTIIGVTGTKGKSTTASIICQILKKTGKKIFLLGNIGEPMLSYLNVADEETLFVCELSAHQLYNLNQSPHIAVITNIYPEHLDYYQNYSEYINAKANIAIHQSKNDYLIYNGKIPEAVRIAEKSTAQKIDFAKYKYEFRQKSKLLGSFNLENAKIGAIVGKLMGLSEQEIDSAAADFQPLSDRLEFVGRFNGVDCYNDSLSTIQESAVAALEALGDRVSTLIAGGFDRGQPFDKLAAAILESNLKTLILFPTTGTRIWEEVKNRAEFSQKSGRLNDLESYFVETMNEAVDLVFKKTEKGEICLLSAASASFGGFADYADRGDRFKKCLFEISASMNGND